MLVIYTRSTKSSCQPKKMDQSRITSDLELETIDLLPLFREATGRGELLYHPFDSHWNAAGRQRAAEHIAARAAAVAG